MKTRAILTAAAALGLAALTLTGCEQKASGPAPNKNTSTPAATTPTAPKADAGAASTAAAGAAAAATAAPGKKTIRIGVIAKSQTNPVFQAARTGAEDAGRELSEKLGIDIKVMWQTPVNEDAQAQSRYIEQLVSSGVNGISISCTDAKVVTSAINAAVENGVHVVTFDSDAPDSKRFAYYGIDDVAAGRAVMEELAKAMGGKGSIGILGGNQTAPNLQARIRGVQEELAKHPNIKLQGVHYHVETPDQAVAKLEQVQGANPDITGWAMVGGWPLFTENALDRIYKSAKVVSVDTLPAQLKYVENGQVQMLIGQDCYGWGYETVRMLVDKIHEKKDPPKVINNFELQRVNKENVAKYKGLWEKWLKGTDGK
jgi:ribose transport system substrate-binding protein